MFWIRTSLGVSGMVGKSAVHIHKPLRGAERATNLQLSTVLSIEKSLVTRAVCDRTVNRHR